MSVICEDIPNTEDVKKILHEALPSLVRVQYVDESKIPGIDATKLAPCTLPVYYKAIANKIEKFKVYSDDVWVISFPKCGTTWTQEMVWLIANDLDFDSAKQLEIYKRQVFLEQSGLTPNLNSLGPNGSVGLAEDLPRPRFIKSHLPIGLLPTEFWAVKPKTVYIARNPKDVAISFYHQLVNFYGYSSSLEHFLDSFLNGYVNYSPYCDHVLDYWKLRNESNILFTTYEDMFKDLNSVLKKAATFFDKTFNVNQFNQLAKHLSFNEMRKNDAVNMDQLVNELEKRRGQKRPDPNFRFLRRGQVGSAKDEMPVEYQKKFDNWLAEAFKESDFKFNV